MLATCIAIMYLYVVVTVDAQTWTCHCAIMPVAQAPSSDEHWHVFVEYDTFRMAPLYRLLLMVQPLKHPLSDSVDAFSLRLKVSLLL